MHLHKNGQKEYIKELEKQRDSEIKAIKGSAKSNDVKQSLVNRVIKKFTQLIQDKDESLFVQKILS